MSRPATAAEAYEWGNASPPKAFWHSSSSGSIELAITLEDARSGSHQGACDDDISALREVPYIKEQLEQVSAEALARELREYGAWDDDELADHEQNLARFLWLACGDIREENVE